jgi:hypothetical protein
LIPNKKERQKVIAYEDELMRLLLSLDNITVGGIELIREKRKRLVKDIQQLLDKIEKVKLICKKLEEIETVALSHRTTQNPLNTVNSPEANNNNNIEQTKEIQKEEGSSASKQTLNAIPSKAIYQKIQSPQSTQITTTVQNRIPKLSEMCKSLIKNALQFYSTNAKNS